jgi:hypothetical protein
MAGALANLKTGQPYHVSVSVQGSVVTLNVNGIEVLRQQLVVATAESQVGVFCISSGEIRFSTR